MADPLVTPIEVEALLLRPLTAAQSMYIDDLCAQASTKLRAKLPAIDDRIAAYPAEERGIDPDAVAAMLAGVIVAYMVNPTGATSTSQTVGAVSRSTAWSSSGAMFARGQIVITADDLAQLVPQRFAVPGTIRTRSGWCTVIGP